MKLIYGNRIVKCFSEGVKLSDSEVIAEFDPNDLFLEVGFGETSEEDVRDFLNSFSSNKKRDQLIKEITDASSKLGNDESSDLIDKTKLLGALKVMSVING